MNIEVLLSKTWVFELDLNLNLTKGFKIQKERSPSAKEYQKGIYEKDIYKS
jgi:hypothetical protein